jgi:FKBP-type peptidyl-prolyl cis-trans isomerase FklB
VKQCETKFMTKQTKTIAMICAFAFFSAGAASARQTPVSSNPPAAAQTAEATKPATAGTAKTGQTNGAATVKRTTTAAAPLVLKTQKDKASYAIGQNVGKGLATNLKRDNVDVNNAVLLRGLRDALTGAKPSMTDDEMKAAMTALQADLKSKREASNQVAGSANKTAGEAFLAANKAKDGVVTLPSGLQYKVLKAGDGPKPTAADTVVCNYRGTLIDGKEFDASEKHGGPATFPVSGVIKGWTEALQLMPVGSKWQLYIPSDMAYGAAGAGADIGPNSTLIFDVELVSIKGK